MNIEALARPCISNHELYVPGKSVEEVKKEIARQFKWHDIILSDEKFTVLNYGDYTNTQLISYSFKARYEKY